MQGVGLGGLCMGVVGCDDGVRMLGPFRSWCRSRESAPCPLSSLSPPQLMPLSSSQSSVKLTLSKLWCFFRRSNESCGFFTHGLSGWFYFNGGSFAGCGWGCWGSRCPVQQTQWHRTKDFEPKILNQLFLFFHYLLSFSIFLKFKKLGFSPLLPFFHFIDCTKYVLLNI